MIRNIVFDMGQVMIRWQPEYYLGQGSFSVEDKEKLLKEVFRSVEWVQLDRGSITLEEAAAAMRSRLPEHLHDAVWEYGIDWYRWPLVPMPGMADLVRELKEKGYGIYLLSNCSLPLRPCAFVTEYAFQSSGPGVPGYLPGTRSRSYRIPERLRC